MPSFTGNENWPVVLNYGALVLRPLRRRDEMAWQSIRVRNREWTGPWDATNPPESTGTPMTFSKMVRAQHAAARMGAQLPWGLAWNGSWPQGMNRLTSAPLVGQLSVSGITYGSARMASIGYWIDQEYAGRGLMPIAVGMACDYCFTTLRLHRIEICIRPENEPSHRVVEKLGLRKEGFRPRFLHISGDWRDHDVFAMTREEYPAGGLVERLTQGRVPQP